MLDIPNQRKKLDYLSIGKFMIKNKNCCNHYLFINKCMAEGMFMLLQSKVLHTFDITNNKNINLELTSEAKERISKLQIAIDSFEDIALKYGPASAEELKNRINKIIRNIINFQNAFSILILFLVLKFPYHTMEKSLQIRRRHQLIQLN